MELLDGLALTCTHWRNECHACDLDRLERQKHAAHTQVYRLKLKLLKQEVAHSILIHQQVTCPQCKFKITVPHFQQHMLMHLDVDF